MKESKFTLEIRKVLENNLEVYIKKIVSAMGMSEAGIPDLIGCYQSKFFGIECKCLEIPHREDTRINFNLSENQIINLEKIESAHGIALVLVYFKDLRKCLFWDWHILSTNRKELLLRIEIKGFKISEAPGAFKGEFH